MQLKGDMDDVSRRPRNIGQQFFFPSFFFLLVFRFTYQKTAGHFSLFSTRRRIVSIPPVRPTLHSTTLDTVPHREEPDFSTFALEIRDTW